MWLLHCIDELRILKVKIFNKVSKYISNCVANIPQGQNMRLRGWLTPKVTTLNQVTHFVACCSIHS